MPNLTPSEIAEITRKLNLISPESPQEYIAAALELALGCAAEIKRLREGIEEVLKHWSLTHTDNSKIHLQHLLNSQP